MRKSRNFLFRISFRRNIGRHRPWRQTIYKNRYALSVFCKTTMIRRMKIVKGPSLGSPRKLPNRRATRPPCACSALLEVMAAKDQRYSLQGLVEETGLPKPTLHRMLQQLEGAGLLQREGDGRHYGIGTRLRRLAENLLLNDSLHGARHTVLRQLVEEIGESCNLTALSGSEVVYLDRVETAAPLRFYLHPGSRVPVHCSASGKIFLAQMSRGAAPPPAVQRAAGGLHRQDADRPRGAREGSAARAQGRLRDRPRRVPARPAVHRRAGAFGRRARPRTCASRCRRR
jgi:DNA-binding IclR family transcriptional regulator